MSTKLKPKEIKEVRERIGSEQGGTCCLCHKELKVPCLDHNHRAPGNVRGVLCRLCNLALGRFENLRRYQIPDSDIITFIRSCANYLEHHQVNRTGLIHPTYLTPEEKNERRKLRAKRARARRNRT